MSTTVMFLTEAEVNALKPVLRWGTYGKGGAEHCGGTCPEHQLKIKPLTECDTDHLQMILRNQQQVHIGPSSFYSLVIRSILQDRGVTPEEFDPIAAQQFSKECAEGFRKRVQSQGDDMDFKVPDLNSTDGSTAVSTPVAPAIDTTDWDNETRTKIFVFGSNKEGAHGGGAAREARLHHGAIWGQGEGLQGSSYAIFTCGKPVGQPGYKIDLQELHDCVQRFLDEAVAEENGDNRYAYQVTQIGTGLAGWRTDEIAPLFQGAPSNVYFDAAWADYLDPNAKFWGTFIPR